MGGKPVSIHELVDVACKPTPSRPRRSLRRRWHKSLTPAASLSH